MNKIVLLSGIPASGKTTLAQKLVDKGYVCLNADSIREELWGDAAEQKEKEKVFAIFFQRLEKALTRGWDIVIDNTNINRNHRHPIIERARNAGYTDIQIWILDTPLEICLKRNLERARQVPEEIVINMHSSLHGSGKPQKSEAKVVLVRPGESLEDYRFFVLS